MLCFKDYYFLYEEITKEQITPYEKVFGGVKIFANIIRNAGTAAREKIKKESEYGLDIAFIIYAPTKNIYFFNRDLLGHTEAARMLGLSVSEGTVDESLCGYFNVLKSDNRISISSFTTNFKWFKQNNINIKDLTIEAFKKSLIIINPDELKYLSAFK